MMSIRMMLSAAAITAATAAAAQAPAQAPAGDTAPGPDRLIRCTVGRVTNMAARTSGDLGLEGEHTLVILQPDAAIEYASKPPRPSSAAKLVRFHDPDQVLQAQSVGVVIDAWPKAVDFLTRQPDGRDAFVSIGSIALGNNTAMVSAGMIQPDRETVDPSRFFQGNCSIEVGPGLAKDFDKLAGAKR